MMEPRAANVCNNSFYDGRPMPSVYRHALNKWKIVK